MRRPYLSLAVALAVPIVLVLVAPSADAQLGIIPSACVETTADAACEDAAASLTGDATCSEFPCVAASGSGDADAGHGVAASVFGDADGNTAASGFGDATTCHYPDDGTIILNCVAASGAGVARADALAVSGFGDAYGDWFAFSVTHNSTCRSTGPAVGPSTGCGAATGTGHADGPGPAPTVSVCDAASDHEGGDDACVHPNLEGVADAAESAVGAGADLLP